MVVIRPSSWQEVRSPEAIMHNAELDECCHHVQTAVMRVGLTNKVAHSMFPLNGGLQGGDIASVRGV